MRKVVADVLEEDLASMFTKILNHTADVLTLDAVNEEQDDEKGTYGNLTDALHNLLVASMLHRFCQGTKGAVASPDAYNKLKSKVDADFISTVIAYVTNLNDAAGEEVKSALLKLLRP